MSDKMRFRRVLSAILAVIMLVSLVQLFALADEAGETPEIPEIPETAPQTVDVEFFIAQCEECGVAKQWTVTNSRVAMRHAAKRDADGELLAPCANSLRWVELDEPTDEPTEEPTEEPPATETTTVATTIPTTVPTTVATTVATTIPTTVPTTVATTRATTVATTVATTRATTVATTAAPRVVITFDLNYTGASVAPVTVNGTGRINNDDLRAALGYTASNPSRTGFTFDGWFTARTGGTQVTTGSSVGTVFTTNQTVYARWTSNTTNPSGVCTITFNLNYTGAPANTTRNTDAQGSLTPLPLPTPTRSGFAFAGWFTVAAQTGGARILSGATGTKFTENTTIFARWTPVTPVNMANIPPAMKENFDWLRYTRHEQALPGYNTSAERIYFNANGSLRQRNSVFDMIWEGNGTVNWVVRWESNRVITLAERQNMARMLHESINVWTRPLIGMPGWPFGEIEVVLVGWAVSNANVIQDRQPNEQVWVNNTHESPFGEASTTIASAPRAMSRFINFGGSGNVNRTYQYPGGLHNRFDMYQWVTQGFGGAVGGDWGNRTSDTRIIAMGANPNGVQIHEVGHSFGLYDLYGTELRKPPNTTVADSTGNRQFGRGDLRTVMDSTAAYTNGQLNTYDQWQIRYYWDWIYNQRLGTTHAFRLPTVY